MGGRGGLLVDGWLRWSGAARMVIEVRPAAHEFSYSLFGSIIVANSLPEPTVTTSHSTVAFCPFSLGSCLSLNGCGSV